MGLEKNETVNGSGAPTVKTMVYSPPLLKDLAGEAADAEGLSLSEWIVRAIAYKLGRPDLGVVPKKPPGPKRKVCIPGRNG